MKQERQQVGQMAEGHGDHQVVHRDYAVRCPECQQMVTDYGEYSTEIDGETHQICTPCGKKLDAENEETTTYTLTMTDDGGAKETVEILAADVADAEKQAKAATRDWLEGGEWGNGGASVSGYWSLTDADGDEVASGGVTVEIEPDHAALIKKACGGVHDRRHDRLCGGDPDDHTWTREGEGGLDSNPGVWSTGGTSMTFASHCCECGLHRVEHHTGSQRNPGEHDTVEYEMPETWCGECQAEECDCEKDDDNDE